MKTRYNGGILVKKKITTVLTILFIVISGGIYMYNKLTKPNLSPKTAKL